MKYICFLLIVLFATVSLTTEAISCRPQAPHAAASITLMSAAVRESTVTTLSTVYATRVEHPP